MRPVTCQLIHSKCRGGKNLLLFQLKMSSPQVRLCHPGDFDQFFNFKNSKFGGHFGYLTDDFIQFTNRLTNDSTVVHPNHGFGEPIDSHGNFDGCIGRLQTNQSDILFYPSDYPMEATGIDQGLVLFDTILVIGQNYFVNKPVKGGQIFDSLGTTRQVLPFITLLILVVTILLHLRESLRVKYVRVHSIKNVQLTKKKLTNYRYLFYVLAHATRYGNIQGQRLFHRLLFISMSIFSLIVVHYYSSFIKTNLVIIREPELWTSYQDLIDLGIRPFFIRGMHSDYYFEHSQPDSPRNQVWTYAVSHFNMTDIIVPPNPLNFQKIAVQMMRRETALIIDALMAKTVQLAACNFKARSIDAFYSMWNTDPAVDLLERAREFLFHSLVDSSESRIRKGLALSKFFTGKAASVIRRALRRSIENGLHFSKLRHIQTYDIFSFIEQSPEGKRQSEKMSFVRDCLSDSVIRPPASMVSDIEIINIVKLFCVYLLLLALSFVFIFAELRMSHK